MQGGKLLLHLACLDRRVERDDGFRQRVDDAEPAVIAGKPPAHAGLSHWQAVLPVEPGIAGIEQGLQLVAHG